MKTDGHDSVNNPSHYAPREPGGRDCIEKMVDTFGVEAVIAYCRAAAYKYRWRDGKKEGNARDLEKAAWHEGFAKGLGIVGKAEPEKTGWKKIYLVQMMRLVSTNIVQGRAECVYQCDICRVRKHLWWEVRCSVPCPHCNVASEGEDQHED